MARALRLSAILSAFDSSRVGDFYKRSGEPALERFPTSIMREVLFWELLGDEVSVLFILFYVIRSIMKS